MEIYKTSGSLAPLFIRITTGTGFMVHGWAKITRGLGGFERLLTQIGIPLSHLNALIIPYIELLGGLALFIGIGVRIVSLPLIMTMLVAMFTIQIRFGFSTVNTIGLTQSGPVFGPPGYEINLIYIGGLLSLLVTGAGTFSIDALIHPKRSGVR